MKNAIWAALLLLLILHQDFWWWDDATLLFGFLPIGVAYHIGISLAAAFLWWLASRYCWPVPEVTPYAVDALETKGEQG